jgi:hypothetical protein
VVVADHEIAIGVVLRVAIYMMGFSAGWQLMPERLLSAHDMDLQQEFASGSGVMHRGFIAAWSPAAMTSTK